MVPAPPEAITGMGRKEDKSAVKSLAKPALVPSWSMEVSKISPAPLSANSLAQAWVISSVALRPPWVCTLSTHARWRVSTATTTHWEPNSRAIWSMMMGLFTAAELIEILSAPAARRRYTSSKVDMPPPTVKGMLISLATCVTSAARVLRLSTVAVMSKNTNSSAPCWE